MLDLKSIRGGASRCLELGEAGQEGLGPGRHSNGGRGKVSMGELEMASTRASEGQKGVALKMTMKDS